VQEFPYREIFAGEKEFLPLSPAISPLDSGKQNLISGRHRAIWASKFSGGIAMGERRRSRRYEVYLPLQVCMSKNRPSEFHAAQLRDISRSGLFYHSGTPVEPGTSLELTFALPAERDRGTSVLVRASVEVLRRSSVESDLTPLYGIAAAIDRIDFVRPMVANVAA
jgi:hypothetical protein